MNVAPKSCKALKLNVRDSVLLGVGYLTLMSEAWDVGV